MHLHAVKTQSYFLLTGIVSHKPKMNIEISFIQHNYSPCVGTQPSPTATSPRSCPSGQFSCPPPGRCIAAEQRCDGIPHCPKGEDETGCHPYNNITTQSDRWRGVVFISSSYVSRNFVITTLNLNHSAAY